MFFFSLYFPSNIFSLSMQVRPQAGFFFVIVRVILVAMWLHSMSSYDELWWKTTIAKWEEFAHTNLGLWGFHVYPASEPWSAVAPNKGGGPPVLPEAIIKIKQNMLCGRKTWQAVEAKHFPAMVAEITFSIKSLGYYQAKRCGNNPAAAQMKGKQV